MDYDRFLRQGGRKMKPEGEGIPSNKLIDALEKTHEDAMALDLSAAEYGQRVIDALAGASREDIAEAANYLSHSLGQAAPGDARMAAIERLTEMRAAGKISKEDFERERKRLSEY